MSNEAANYSAPRRLFHWGMAVLLIAGLAGVELHESFPRDSTARNLLIGLHFQMGLLIFLLVWPRIALALREGKPPVTPPLVPWQAKLSAATHGLLYVAMIIMPVLGVLTIQSSDHAVALLGLQLPRFIGADKDLSRTLHEVHETIGNVVIALLVLHIAAAVWHHRFLKDDTLTRMLPPRGR